VGRGRRATHLLAVDTNRHRNVLFKALSLPVLGSVIRFVMDAKGTVFTHIPVYEGIAVDGGAALPITVAEHFIREASHHVLLDYCPCRKALGCSEYDANIGCIFVGEGAREINPEVGRHVGVEETLDHLHRAVDAGLIPMVGKVKFDADYLGVKDRHRLMTICICCPCCCLAGGVQHAPRNVRNLVVRLEGVEVRVDGDCDGCGICVETCIFKQMKIIDGQAVVGEECKACGRCAVCCPNDAISISVDNPEYIRQCIDRISAYVDVK